MPPEPTTPRKWRQIIGVIFISVSLLFFMALALISFHTGNSLPSSPTNHFILLVILAISLGAGVGFLGGDAYINGEIPIGIPQIIDSPLKFGLTGGAAVTIIVLLVGQLFFYNDHPDEADVNISDNEKKDISTVTTNKETPLQFILQDSPPFYEANTEEVHRINQKLSDSFSINFQLIDSSDRPDGDTNYSIFYLVVPEKSEWDGIWMYKMSHKGLYTIHLRNKSEPKYQKLYYNPLKDTFGRGNSTMQEISIKYDRNSGQLDLFVDGKLAPRVNNLGDSTAQKVEVEIGRYLSNKSVFFIGRSHLDNNRQPWEGSIKKFEIY